MMTKERLTKLLEKAERPILIVGAGCRNKKLIERFNLPTFLTWGAMDVLEDNHPLNLREFGITSNRAANFILNEADLIIALGTRLDTHEVNGKWRSGKLVSIDIDKSELHESADLKICMDANNLDIKCIGWNKWLQKCKKALSLYKNDTLPYLFIEELSRCAKKATIITDAGQTLTWTMQAWKVKKGQRLFSAFNHSPMGYAIPGIIGAHFANDNQLICITGDGGLQMNLQELQTIRGYNIPAKIFVMDNNGYGMIKQTIGDWPKFLKEGVACTPYMENLLKIAKCFGFRYVEIKDEKEFWKIPLALAETEPVIIRVIIPERHKIQPKLKLGDEMTDLSPKITNEEKNEIIKTLR